ncbi:MAG TPA: hypothetical protein VJT73_09795 [Polyangiaceae bacterium]|nr:hypothetical protein [Polyangiaceae bacterium]
MRFDRAHFLVSVSAFLCAFALTLGNAFAGGSISYAKKEIQESGGGWHLMMTVSYGGKPHLAHVPMRFTFTPTAILENFLDDAHGDKPQKRKIALVGQTPIQESVDVDFSDPRGKLYDKTRFDFTITRSHNFSAGDYSVTVHKADGSPVGGAVTLVLLGDNPVIDRRAISFVGAKKEKDKDKTGGTDAGTGTSATETKTAAAEGETPATGPAASAGEIPPSEEPVDPTAPAKVPPGSRGCGCRTANSRALGDGGWLALGMAGVISTALRRLRRRRVPASAREAASAAERGTA